MFLLQFRILYREFLFRMVDLELLSSSGDMNKLMGQFAALLISFSLALTLGAAGFTGSAVHTWNMQHFLISTTMLIVGLFAVLAWDSTFPDSRDVLVLSPLPIPASTLFVAKVAATASALSLTIAAFHSFAGLVWPFALAPQNAGVRALLKCFIVYWFTMFSAGSFVFCFVLALQGLASQLPRRFFLRISAFLQLSAFCGIISVYFLEPPHGATDNPSVLAWLPDYWFVAFYSQLNGATLPTLGPSAQRAWLGLATALCTTLLAYALSYFRMLRRTLEEPDIVPSFRGANWLPRFGNAFETSVVHFGICTLVRSRRHRILLAFFLGTAFALVISFARAPNSQELAPLVATILMLSAALAGIRILFALPIDLQAHWIFKIAPVRGGPEGLAANRRLLIVLAIAPVWLASSLLLLSIWPWQKLWLTFYSSPCLGVL